MRATIIVALSSAVFGLLVARVVGIQSPIPAPVMESLIAKTKFAISMEESRYTLNGGLLILKPNTLAMVATDGHRLALAETDQKLAGLNGEMKAMDEVEYLAVVCILAAHITIRHFLAVVSIEERLRWPMR